MEIIEFSVRGWHDALGFLSDIKWDFEDSNKNMSPKERQTGFSDMIEAVLKI